MTARLHHTDLLDRATSDALRSLDPAADVDQQVVAGPRAQDTLARILATDSAGPATTPPPVRTGWARPRRRWVLAGAALVGAGALVVAPGMVRDQSAFASWSATATAVAPGPATVAGQDCRTTHARMATRLSQEGQSGLGSDRTVVQASDIVLVERRGAWTFVVLGGPGGFEATCLLRDNGPGGEVSQMGSSATLAAGTVASNTAVTHGANAMSYDDLTYREITGRVGSDVASVVINTREQGPVNASVHGGYFAAWWPGPPTAGVDGTDPQPTITLILKDRTTNADIPMAHLDPARN